MKTLRAALSCALMLVACAAHADGAPLAIGMDAPDRRSDDTPGIPLPREDEQEYLDALILMGGGRLCGSWSEGSSSCRSSGHPTWVGLPYVGEDHHPDVLYQSSPGGTTLVVAADVPSHVAPLGTQPDAAVPEVGATALLLGGAWLGLRALRRRLGG
jgi:hypothetical protein